MGDPRKAVGAVIKLAYEAQSTDNMTAIAVFYKPVGAVGTGLKPGDVATST